MKRLASLALVAALVTLAGDGGRTLPPCPTEDSVACHWDATKDGNGQGVSFDVDGNGRITYTTTR